MVRLFWSLILKISLTLFCGTAVAQAQVKVYPTTVQLGEPITLVLMGEAIEQDFALLDKSAIRQSFEIYDIEGGSDRLRLTLYPLSTGILNLPKMQQGQIAFAGAAITVKENTDVQVIWQRLEGSATELFAQQRYFWQAKVKTAAENAVTLEAHPHQKAPIEQAYQPEAVAAEQGLFGLERFFLMAYWTEQEGSFALRSPVIRVKNSSQKTWLFFDKTQSVRVKPLPSYLPLGLPVGHLALQAASLPWFLEAGELTIWSMRLTGDNLLAQGLPHLPQQFQDASAKVEWLTPTHKTDQAWSKLGWKTHQDWQLPFRVSQTGWVKLPAVRLTFFDVSSQQLQDVWLPSISRWVLPSGAFTFFKGLGLILVLGAGLLVLLVVRGFYQKWQAVWAVKRCDDIEQVWWVLRQFNLSSVWGRLGRSPQASVNPKALSIEAGLDLLSFVGTTNRTENVSHETLRLIELLNRHFYGPSQTVTLQECQALAQSWLLQQSVFQRLLKELRTIRYFLKAIPKA